MIETLTQRLCWSGIENVKNWQTMTEGDAIATIEGWIVATARTEFTSKEIDTALHNMLLIWRYRNSCPLH